MGKAVGGFFRFIFAVVILLLLGYNTFETWRLRQEVNALKQQQEQQAPAPKTSAASVGRGGAESSGSALDLVARAREHANQARALLREKRYAEAQRELALAAQATRQAGDGARDQSAGALASLRSTVESLSAQADSLMRDDSDDGAAKGAPPGGAERRPEKESEKTRR